MYVLLQEERGREGGMLLYVCVCLYCRLEGCGEGGGEGGGMRRGVMNELCRRGIWMGGVCVCGKTESVERVFCLWSGVSGGEEIKEDTILCFVCPLAEFFGPFSQLCPQQRLHGQ